MITFTNNSILIHQHCANHWIWRNKTCSHFCELQTTMHVLFVCSHSIFYLPKCIATMMFFLRRTLQHSVLYATNMQAAKLTEIILTLQYGYPGSLYTTHVSII